MTPEEIDKLSGEDLDAAIADATGRGTEWNGLPRPIDGNVAVELLEKMREWGCQPVIGAHEGRYSCSGYGADGYPVYGVGETLPIAVAKMFLRVHMKRIDAGNTVVEAARKATSGH